MSRWWLFKNTHRLSSAIWNGNRQRRRECEMQQYLQQKAHQHRTEGNSIWEKLHLFYHIHYFLPCPRFIQFVRHNLPFCVFVSNFVDARVLYYLLLESCRMSSLLKKTIDNSSESLGWRMEGISMPSVTSTLIRSLCLEFAFFYDVAFATSANATCKCML